MLVPEQFDSITEKESGKRLKRQAQTGKNDRQNGVAIYRKIDDYWRR